MPPRGPAPLPKPEYPMRINKYLADRGISTRRGADELVSKGKVTINGRQAVLGDKVNETDDVKVDPKSANRTYVYLAYNKPIGIVTSTPQEGEEGIEDVLKFPVNQEIGRVFPIGRLDKESHGLIILTNDGRITEKLLSPEFDHEKEYSVEVNKPITERFVTRMSKGVNIGDYVTKECQVTKTDETRFSIVLTEGKRHQIRRMVTEQGYEVVDLKRVRIMNVRLGGVQAGSYRMLRGDELSAFLSSLGMR